MTKYIICPNCASIDIDEEEFPDTFRIACGNCWSYWYEDKPEPEK